MYKLIITEKPSVAQSIATALGIKNRKNGYIEGNGWLISWCLGHLAELADADVYDEKYGKWSLADLPIIPVNWRYVVPGSKKEQFLLVRDLMNREDVSEVVNACDAGREGELIFRNVYALANCKKPMKRLWLASMEEDAIRESFENLHDGAEFNGLYHAALARAKADWIVGINATRLYSMLYHRTLNVGRVMSATLSMLAQRQSEIDDFESKSFYTPVLTCNGVEFSGDRFESEEDAAAIADTCELGAIVTSVEREEKTVKAPPLFDLTTLQREANRRCGYTAQQTLDYLQSLYEKQLCTYPRTDSRYLTDDMEGMVKTITLRAAEICKEDAPDLANPSVVCDSSQVSDHHAIVPTATAAGLGLDKLPDGESVILALICWSVLRAVAGDYRYAETTVTVESGGHFFTVKDKEVLELGWMLYEPKERNHALPAYFEHQMLDVTSSVKEGHTSSPKDYTEDTLLAAMEKAGSGNMPEDAERKGIGTPATRAGILEKLVATGFIVRKKYRKLVRLIPTQAGVSLSRILPEQLRSPEMTAEWEHRLKLIERGEFTETAFLEEITDMIRDLVADATPVPGADQLFPSGKPVIGKCPRCGGNVTESRAGYFCESMDCKFALWKDNQYLAAKRINLTPDRARTLLEDGQVMVHGMYSDRTGNKFDAMLVLADDGEHMRYKLSFDYAD